MLDALSAARPCENDASSAPDPFTALRRAGGEGCSEIEMQRYLLARPSVIAGWKGWSMAQRQVTIDKYLATLSCL
jgi:hypothetical protein